MNNKTLRILIPALGAALLLSCQVEKELVPASPVAEEEILPATVSLQLTLDGELNGTPQTRSIDDNAGTENFPPTIRNLCILQYNGTGNNAPMVGKVHYLRDDVDPDDENYLNLNQIKLADSQHETHTLVILANTFTQIADNAAPTLGEMLALTRLASGEADVFGHTGQGEGFPDDTEYYQRLNAVVVTPVSNDAVIRGVLRRSMARINVEIVNSGRDNLQIRKVQLRNVSQQDHYVTDYRYLDPEDAFYPDVTKSNSSIAVTCLVDGNGNDRVFRDEYLSGVTMRMDYGVQTWTGTDDGSVHPLEGTGTARYTWYVPSNMRGRDDSITMPSEKNVSGLALGATYLYILGSYGPGQDQLIEYRFYLGENLKNDFNLRPNTSYSYRFTFDGKGDLTTDRRVEDYGTVNFALDANCYIVNPPSEGVRKYTFNVVHRPNIFWGVQGQAHRYEEVHQAYNSNYIRSNEVWKARILWSDFMLDKDGADQVDALLTRREGTGNGAYGDANQRVELTVPSDILDGTTPRGGNIVIGIWSAEDDPNNILWSWHIWITDYQPDDIVGHRPDEGAYLYNVKGGEVHRYAVSAWTGTGRYKDGYAMDRNLGALDDCYHAGTRGDGFYYQFGRKDPFAANYTVYNYVATKVENGVTITRTPAGNGGLGSSISYSDLASPTGDYRTGGKNVPWSVLNPRRFITGSYWTYNDIFNPVGGASYVWQDPAANEAVEKGDNEEKGKNLTKSFFDPCPPGWRLPVNGWVTGFTGDGAGWSTTNGSLNFQWDTESFNGHNRGTGSTYYPLTIGHFKDNPRKDDPTAFFPGAGDRDGGRGGIYSNRGDIWSSSPSSEARGLGLGFTSGGLGASHAYGPRTNGSPVRCVRESYQ